MKLAITSQGTDRDSPVDPRFGRAASFIIYDTETESYTAHSNEQNLNAAQGAGIQAAQNAESLDADWVLTGHCGPKAFRVLQAAGIKIAVEIKGTVEEAVARFLAGEIEETDNPDVEGHWV